ncbi:winged helix-turn-helix transcriptional regulator [Streptomyces sp. NPDC005134]|uniref:winged helix-turn-helix transcriptional regulator n=1 Tax=Streptomyces sp. NPDC005098 TaxID=3154560 RepID=UPI0033AB6A58
MGVIRRYGQACPLATAMDVLGERWTVLILRELLLGPKRFTEILGRMPSIGPNRLTDRLRTLHTTGVVSKAESTSEYTLTEFGEGLRTPIIGLGLWGLGLMSDGVDPSTARPDMVALCMTAATDPGRLAGLALECDVDAGERFSMTVSDGVLQVRSGPSPASSPSTITCDVGTFIALSLGSETPSAAVSSGRLAIGGDIEAVSRLFETFADAARRHTAVQSAPLTT